MSMWGSVRRALCALARERWRAVAARRAVRTTSRVWKSGRALRRVGESQRLVVVCVVLTSIVGSKRHRAGGATESGQRSTGAPRQCAARAEQERPRGRGRARGEVAGTGGTGRAGGRTRRSARGERAGRPLSLRTPRTPRTRGALGVRARRRRRTTSKRRGRGTRRVERRWQRRDRLSEEFSGCGCSKRFGAAQRWTPKQSCLRSSKAAGIVTSLRVH
jgi:hypothetical protein